MDQGEKTKLWHPKKGVREFGPVHAFNIMITPEAIRGGWEYYEGQDKGGEESIESIESNAVNDDPSKGDIKSKTKRKKGRNTEG